MPLDDDISENALSRWVYCGDANSYLLCDAGLAHAVIFHSHGRWHFYSRPYNFRSDGHATPELAAREHARLVKFHNRSKGYGNVQGICIDARGSHLLKRRLQEAEAALLQD